MRIALNPEYFELLRKEIVDVLGSRGLSKQSLTDLKLMDAVIKETQRLKPVILSRFPFLIDEDARCEDVKSQVLTNISIQLPCSANLAAISHFRTVSRSRRARCVGSLSPITVCFIPMYGRI